MIKKSWVVVGNSTEARFFELTKDCQLVEVQTLCHPEGRLPERELTSDKRGAATEGKRPGRHAMEPPMSHKQAGIMVFAKQVADYLEAERVKGSFERVYLAASPNFLGVLRQNFTPPTAALVESEVAKDITHLKPEKIRSYFPICV